MRTCFRVALVVVATLLAAYAANFGYRQLNQPSDLRFGLGMVILVVLFVFGLPLIFTILRNTAPRPKACGVPEEGTVNAEQTPSNRANSTSAGS